MFFFAALDHLLVAIIDGYEAVNQMHFAARFRCARGFTARITIPAEDRGASARSRRRRPDSCA
jgi:hypothetical protein